MKRNIRKIAIPNKINMKRHLVIAFFAGLLLASCTPSAQKKAAEIEKLETELKESGKKGIADTTKVKELMNDYRSYVKAFPTDSLTPVYLMKSAKFYDFTSYPDSAIYCYNLVYYKFPNYPKANLALFSEAFIYANEKHNLLIAKALYKEYLAKYPNTKLAESAKLELDNLGKSPDQVMSELDSLKQARKDNVAGKP